MYTKNDKEFKARHASARRALTLLELTVVVTILGIFATMAATKFGTNSLANTSAQGYARKLALDLLQAQRRTISTGDVHSIVFTLSGSSATGYALNRTTVSGTSPVDEAHAVPNDIVITPSVSTMSYAFDSSAGGSYTCTIAGTDRTWLVSVVQGTGFVRVTEN